MHKLNYVSYFMLYAKKQKKRNKSKVCCVIVSFLILVTYSYYFVKAEVYYAMCLLAFKPSVSVLAAIVDNMKPFYIIQGVPYKYGGL